MRYAMEEGYKNLSEKPFESHYLHVETIIDYPVGKVWPHAVNIGGWMSAHRLETIAGESGTVGHFERVWPRNLDAQTPAPHYHLYGVAHLIPFKYIALEVFPERHGSYGNPHEWISFDSILLTDLGAKTQVTFVMVDAHLGQWDERFRDSRMALFEPARKQLEGYLVNLKQLVAAG